jgi:hypothetical protein
MADKTSTKPSPPKPQVLFLKRPLLLLACVILAMAVGGKCLGVQTLSAVFASMSLGRIVSVKRMHEGIDERCCLDLLCLGRRNGEMMLPLRPADSSASSNTS